MVNSSKTPTGKTSKGKVSIYVEKGRIKARLPRQYFGGEQPRIALGMDANEANMARAQRLAERMTLDLQDGCFDETLAKYGIIADLKLKGSATTSDDESPPKPELSILEVWDMYCEYRKHDLAETTYEVNYKRSFRNLIESSIKATKSEDAIAIRNWLLENRSRVNTRRVLSLLSDAYNVCLRRKLLTYNPYDGLSEGISINEGSKGYTQDENDDSDVLNQAKAFTWEEAQLILEYVKNKTRLSHWFNFLKFKFLTGCRTGEAIGLWWCDVKWAEEKILIRRSYSVDIKKFKATKNEKNGRIFPMPKNGELWNLLKSIPQGEPNEVVFKSKTGGIVNDSNFRVLWGGWEKGNRKGIIPTLVEAGILNTYLPPYNTRHTFITHQVFDLGQDEKVVSAWCGHGEMVSQKHYQDIIDKAMQINPDLPASQQSRQQSELDLLKEQLRQQQELINKLLQDKDDLKS